MEPVARPWLISTRKEQSLSQQELAAKADISRNYLSEIENGTKNPSVDVAKPIANVLGIHWTLFFDSYRRETQHTA